MNPARGAWSVVLVIVAISVLYLARLDYSPVYLFNDEIFNALQAWSLAETGRSVAGDYLPVYFRGLEFPPGRDPLCVYGTAAALKLLPPDEIALRLPTAIVGVVNIVLAYLVGKRLWASRRVGLFAALVLATAPAYFIHSRIAIPTLWSLPWLLGWLLALATYTDRRDPKLLFAAFAALGLAVYGYFGTAVMVPLYVAATLAYVYGSLGVRELKPYVFAGAGLFASMIPIIYWQVLHPERWSELVAFYFTSPTVNRSGSPLFTPSGYPSFAAVQERLTAYWNYFNPTVLFLRGDASPRYSTGRAGVFLLPAIVFLPLGAYAAARAGGLGRLILFGFLTAPFAGALANDVQVQRALQLIVFGSLLCVLGAARAWSHLRFVCGTRALCCAWPVSCNSSSSRTTTSVPIETGPDRRAEATCAAPSRPPSTLRARAAAGNSISTRKSPTRSTTGGSTRTCSAPMIFHRALKSRRSAWCSSARHRPRC